MRRFLPLAFAANLAFALAASLPAFAQSNGPAVAPPSAKSARVEALRALGAPVAHIRLAAPDPEAIENLKKANAATRLKRLEIGIGREVDAAMRAMAGSPRFVPAAGGTAAHWQVTSTGAAALRIGLSVASLPARAELRFVGADRPDVVYGPFTASDVMAMGSTFWSPVLEGQAGRLEVFVPAGAAASEVSLEISRISHLFVSPAHPRAEQVAKASGACEVDFICRAASDAALSETGRSVARMTFTGNSGGTAFCTGTLLNPSDNSFTPYFYSAAHCISTQSRASTLTTHWFYETTGCGNNVQSPNYVQVAGGATLLFASTVSDALLLRLNASPPANAIYAGWDAAQPAVNTPMTAIHHPQGDYKKVSLGRVTGFGSAGDLASGNFMRVDWTGLSTGVTEGGSSGSGIFSGNASSGYRFRGGLLGGASHCAAGPSDLYDFYSRFDQVFANIAQYLQPGSQQPQGPNVLANPGFESGPVNWAQSSSNNTLIITNDATMARAGSWYAWLGGNNDLTDTLTQDVVVPSGQARLQFWYRITTNETISGAFDTMTVSVVNPSTGATMETLASFSNQTTTSGWEQSSTYDLSAFSGQTVRLQFRAVNDFSDFTSFRIDDVSITGTTASGGGANYTALWWNPAESGWGVNVNHQGDIVFATLFTYDTTGAPMWLVMSGGVRQGSSDVFTGDLYRTTGPAFNSVPFPPINSGNLTRVGTMSLGFSGANAGSLTYSVNGLSVLKTIQRQVFGAAAATCVGSTASRQGASNYQDLWWNSAESGWGINLTHQGNTIFATLFTYGLDGQGLWLVMSGGVRQSDGSYFGELYRTSGPAFNAQPWTGIGVTQVGTMRLRFASGETGTLEYTVNGAAVSKLISRQVFSSSPPLCSG
ncbi:MAG TPA: choice-of-anchor J domain-containing protein [Usitatibacter sp.]|nr:choice-of-anchor J domain-containing protein [Usitatibacter sp.]